MYAVGLNSIIFPLCHVMCQRSQQMRHRRAGLEVAGAQLLQGQTLGLRRSSLGLLDWRQGWGLVALCKRVPQLCFWAEVCSTDGAWVSAVVPVCALNAQLVLDGVVIFILECCSQVIYAHLFIWQVDECVDGVCIGKDEPFSDIGCAIFSIGVVGVEFTYHVYVCHSRLSVKS
ncbi:hypothetical protein V6N13_005001 [Hibiscus sabdariffa]